MAAQDPMHAHREHHETVDRLLITVVAQVMLICAALVLFFVYLQLPIFVASGLSLALLVFGSLFCWKSFLAARLVLVLSLIAIELALVEYEPSALVPSIALDLAVVFICYLARKPTISIVGGIAFLLFLNVSLNCFF